MVLSHQNKIMKNQVKRLVKSKRRLISANSRMAANLLENSIAHDLAALGVRGPGAASDCARMIAKKAFRAMEALVDCHLRAVEDLVCVSD